MNTNAYKPAGGKRVEYTDDYLKTKLPGPTASFTAVTHSFKHCDKQEMGL